MDDPEATATQTPPETPTVEVPAVPATPAPEVPEAPAPTPAEAEVPEVPAPPDPRDELEDERFKPHLERRDRRIVAAAREEEAKTRQAAQVSVDAQEVGRQIQNVYGNIAQRLEGEGVEVLDKYLPRLEAIAGPYSADEKKKLTAQGHEEGHKKGQAELHQGVLAAVQQSLGQRAWEDMEDYYTKESGLTWVDILDRYHELRSGKWKDEKTTLEAQIEDLKAKARPDGPDTTRKDGADGRSDEEIKLDSTTPIEKLEEIRAREMAGE